MFIPVGMKANLPTFKVTGTQSRLQGSQLLSMFLALEDLPGTR